MFVQIHDVLERTSRNRRFLNVILKSIYVRVIIISRIRSCETCCLMYVVEL